MFLARTLPWAVLATCALLSGPADASAPAPRLITLSQPDGTTLQAHLRGSAFFSWYEDVQGHALVQQQGRWVYAQLQDGKLLPSQVSANDAAPAFAVTGFKAPLTEQQQALQQLPLSLQVERANSQSRSLAASAITGRRALLTIQVAFDDVASQYDFAGTLFGGGKSLVNYYQAQSGGALTLEPATESEGAADGIVHVQLSRNHPACGSDCDYGIDGTLAAALAAADPYVDFSRYDSNGDGTLAPSELAVQFIFAGEEGGYGATGPAIWAHRWVMPTQTLDGKALRDYLVVGERHGDHAATMGIFAHELGHLLLGLPDLYVDGAPAGIGRWGLMGSGSWNKVTSDTYLGQTPSDLSAWSKSTAGLASSEVVDGEGNQQLGGDDIQRIFIDPYLRSQQLGESLYLAYRGGGYDDSLPKAGLLLSQADPRVTDNSDLGRPVLAIIQADGRGDLEAGNNHGDSGDIFPGYRDVRQYQPVTRDGQQSPVLLSAISDAALPMSYSLIVANDNRSALLQHSYQASPTPVSGGLRWGFELNNQVLDGIDFYLPNAGTVTLALHQWSGTSQPGSLIADLGSFSGAAGWHRWLLASPQVLAGKAMLVVASNAGFATEPKAASNQYRPNGQALGQAAQISLLLSASSPVAEGSRDYQFSTLEDQPLTIDLAALGLADVDFELSSNQAGTLSREGDLLIYTPAQNFFGEARFSLPSQVAGTNSSGDRIIVTVEAVNDAPTLSVAGSTSLSGAATLNLVAQGQDVDGDSLSYRWQQTSGPALTFNASSATLNVSLANPASTQSYGFTVTVTDPSGASVSRNLTVSQSPAPSNPGTSSDSSGGGGGGGSLGWLSLLALALLRRIRQ
ncbi:M6 family metalloprotease domain-containing protein [Gallaecimonas xiamenensis]|uniref:Peptidase M6-like domain-containing protein n=1 Tax=Gallaecimonas xiamenensis 3-C-1 TaxID=745411 RepID=K2KCE1_9GAMM|nr:M6 family metalloprotease domain-containing protein [Gallaecimonas xiamenensis]EKE74995.1 hypothetical protein B3C1_08906 [Gallaecimonas xiamenensis 3-C-1]